MNKIIVVLGGASLAILMLVGTVAAAGPSPSPSPAVDQARDRDALPLLLGLTHDQVMDLRRDGLSLAQIAERQKVDPQKLVDALKAEWTERIDARVASGVITATQATQLKTQLDEQARAMVARTTMGGMRGAAVGAGPGAGHMGADGAGGFGAGHMGAGAGRMGAAGMGMGSGDCDGTARP